ncbi:tumor necrosis factor alpha-induced protein 2-like [Hypanus sabinus]|uniref:tumor necrosis factor alpha-induced protein 2-like n=1 Tax=Hypanus sabinus TaxID=79690 RepID=UPI0028C48910|nr:tumor necrosis factor alpha-induced protein 2-like [Hypanus sabinus]
MVTLETNFQPESRQNLTPTGFTLISKMKKFKNHIVGNKIACIEEADCSGIGSKSKVKKRNRLRAIFSVFSHKKEKTLNSTEDVVDINGKTWDSVEVLSESDIKELIEKKQYFKADCHLIKLEHEQYTDDTTKADEELVKEQKKGIESLYEILSAEIFTVAKNSMSISKENPDLLKMAVRVILQEEKADQVYLEEKEKPGAVAEVRPRRWETKWLNTIEQSVNERLGELPSIPDAAKVKMLSECLVQHHKKLKEDFDTIVNCIKPCYPQEYNICKKYVEYYHKKSSSLMELIIESKPKGKDVYPFLHWIYSCYPNLLSTVTQSEETSQEMSKTLLPERMISHLKSEYFTALQSDTRTHMYKSLCIEEDKWKSEEEPIVLNGYYHSELPIDIIQIIVGAIQETGTLTNEMVDKTVVIMLEEAHSFLGSFQQSAENFEKSNTNQTNFISIIILITNCCEVFRNYIDTSEKITNTELTEKVRSLLNEMEKKTKDILLKTLFCKLKPYCKKLVTGKWLESSEHMTKMLGILEEHLTKLEKLKAPLYQDILREIHKQLIIEYIIRIMKKKLNCKTVNEQQKVANQIKNEAEQIQKLFSFYTSETTHLESALLKIAEIIRLKDVEAITMEVAALSRDFPDVQKHHIGAILYLKGNMKKSNEKEILNILNTPMNNTTSSVDLKLFTSSTVLKDL